MDLLAIFIVSNFTPWFLELWKDSKVPGMSRLGRYSPILNRLIPILTAVIAAAGIHWSFDRELGRLTIEGLIPSHVLNGILLAATGILTQQYRYTKTIKEESR